MPLVWEGRRRGSDDISAQNLSTSLSPASSQTMPAVFLSLNICNAAQSYKQTQISENPIETESEKQDSLNRLIAPGRRARAEEERENTHVGHSPRNSTL